MSLKATNIKYTIPDTPSRGYRVVKVNYSLKDKDRAKLIYIKNNPKYKENDYINEAKKIFESYAANKLSYRFPIVPVVASLAVVAAIGTGGYFIYRYLNNGGTNTGDWGKVNLAMDATVEKVDQFNETLASITDSQSKLDQNNNTYFINDIDNETIQATYYDDSTNTARYAQQQMFGFYIFYNIYYGAKYTLPDNKLSINTPVYGYTNRMPDSTLQKYWDNLGCKDSLLSVRYNLESDGLYFEADWNFKVGESEAFKENLAIYNAVILTTGKIRYDFNNKKIKGFNLNYFWSDDNRDLGSFDLDFENNKFSCVLASGVVDETSRTWRESDKIAKVWNNGEINHNKLKDYSYRYYYAYSGDITTDVKKLNMKGYYRYIPNTPKTGDIIEEIDSPEKTKFDALYDGTVKTCSAVHIRDLDQTIDISKGKKVNVDDCVKYGEAVSSVYWMHEKVVQPDGSITYKYADVTVIPFLEKDDLSNYAASLLKESITNEQKDVLNKASSYLKSLKEKDYFGTFVTNDVMFYYDGYYAPDDYRYNCYRTTNFSYCFANKNNSVKINFIVKDNKPVLNGYYGTDVKEIQTHDLNWSQVEESLASLGIVLTKKPTVLYDGYNQNNLIEGYYDMRSGFKNYIGIEFWNGTDFGWTTSFTLVYNGVTGRCEFDTTITVYRNINPIFVKSVSLH